MKPEYYYTLRGRKTENYKEPVEAKDHYAIVFAVEMDQEMINRAPQLEEVIAVVKGYMDAGMIGMVLSYMIRELGYEARNHMDGNYLLIARLWPSGRSWTNWPNGTSYIKRIRAKG